MVFGVCYAGLELLDIYAASDRQTCAVGSSGSFQLVGTAEIVACGDIQILCRQKVYADDKMVEQLSSETVFLFRVIIIVIAPSGDVAHGERETERRMFQLCADTHLQVERQVFLVVFMERGQLRANVFGYDTEREILLLVGVMQAEVNADGCGTVFRILGEDVAARSAT